MKITDKHVFFWSGVFSNWHPCEFKVETEGQDITFFNSEQYFMYMKAKLFGDDEIAAEILHKGVDPKTAKDLGRKVKNYDDKVWNEKRYQVMVDACYLKFSQSETLKKKLLDKKFEGKGYVEGSPVDKVWGIGVHWRDASDDESTWNGQNLLGKALDEVRERLLKET